MPVRAASIHGCLAASCFSAATWSGRVLSIMSPYHASWKDLLRIGVPMPSTAMTMKPSSASAWWSPCAGWKLRLRTEPTCGPG